MRKFIPTLKVVGIAVGILIASAILPTYLHFTHKQRTVEFLANMCAAKQEFSRAKKEAYDQGYELGYEQGAQATHIDVAVLLGVHIETCAKWSAKYSPVPWEDFALQFGKALLAKEYKYSITQTTGL